MYHSYPPHGNHAGGESSSHSASPVTNHQRHTSQHQHHTQQQHSPYIYNHHTPSSNYHDLSSSGPSYDLPTPSNAFDYTLPPTFNDAPWSFASTSNGEAPSNNSIERSYDPQPSSAGLPPLPPLPIEDALTDQALAEHQHWGAFAALPNSSSPQGRPYQSLYQQHQQQHPPHLQQNHQRDPSSSSWSLPPSEPPSSFFDSLMHFLPNQPLGGDDGTPLSEHAGMGFTDYFPPPGMMDYGEPVSMNLQGHPGSADGTPTMSHLGLTIGKGKERAGGHGGDTFDGMYGADGYGREVKRSKGEEFDKNVALLQTYVTDLIGLLQPFAASPSQPSPPKPAPFLHTRFLRLSTSVQQTLLQLQPSSQPHLSPNTTHRSTKPHSKYNQPLEPSPRKGKPDKPNGSSRSGPISLDAEKEMELIRKRRDWLIAKAAQAKLATANANALASAHPSSTPTPTPQATNGHYTPGMISASQSPSGSIPLHTPGLHASYFNGGPPPLGNLGNLSGFAGMGNMSNSNSGSGAYTPGSLARMNDGRGPGAGKTADNPSGRCHGCGDQFTTEWRKGPDGAKSLCDACGLHYAKLSRRRESQSPASHSPAQPPYTVPLPLTS